MKKPTKKVTHRKVQKTRRNPDIQPDWFLFYVRGTWTGWEFKRYKFRQDAQEDLEEIKKRSVYGQQTPSFIIYKKELPNLKKKINDALLVRYPK